MWPMPGNLVMTGAGLTLHYVPMELSHLAMAGMIAVLGLTGGFLSILAYRAGEAAIVAPMQYSQIIWATIYGWYIFDEVLDGPTMIGAGVIIASGLYIVWRESARRGDTNQPVIEARLRADTVTTPKSSVLQRILSGRGNSRQ